MEDVAELCGVAPRTVLEWCKAGKIRHYKPGKGYLFRREWIDPSFSASVPWLTVEDVAAQCGVAPRTVYEWCKAERISYARPGKSYRFLQAWIDEVKACRKTR